MGSERSVFLGPVLSDARTDCPNGEPVTIGIAEGGAKVGFRPLSKPVDSRAVMGAWEGNEHVDETNGSN